MIAKTLAHYEITDKLGQGGMGSVWRARDTKLGREVAIKTLPDEFAQDSDRVARFRREAQLLASLNHPNIAAIHGLEEADGTHFLVLELVEGDTLEDRIKRGAIPVEDSLKLALQIADALKAAHDSGVIHRDLKPSNIKITDDDNVKVLDFGLAKALESDTGDANLSQSPTLSMAATQQGMILGTAAYMSPEQAKGRAVDKRADIFAFGCVLYEMLTGRQSFGASDVSESLAAVIRSEPQWEELPKNLHPRLREVVEQCLEKPVAERFQDIGDVRVDINKLLADPAGVVWELSGETNDNQPRTTRLILGAVAGCVALVAVTSVTVWTLMRPAPPPVARFDVTPAEGLTITNNSVSVAVSPDGGSIAYLIGGGPGAGAEELHLRPLDQLGSTILVAEGSLASPLFSPDGSQIGFYETNPALLKRVSTGGGPASVVTELPGGMRGASWGSDGNIIFATENLESGLWRVAALGGEPEQLTTPDVVAGEVDHYWPEVLPSGDAVLFTVVRQEGSQIALLSLGTRDYRVIVQAGAFPRYSPTGHLLYGVDGTLWAVGFDLRRLQTVGDPVPVQEGVLTKGIFGATEFALSENGTLLYAGGDVPADDDAREGLLALVDRDGNASQLAVRSAHYRSPRLSPDGQQLAVEIIDGSGRSDIWIYDLAGESAIRRLTQSGNNTRPVWTADGERVTFGSDRDGSWGIYERLSDGSTIAERLTTADQGLQHYPESWSPDGETLAFVEVAGANAWDIWTFSREDGTSELFLGGTAISSVRVFHPTVGGWPTRTIGNLSESMCSRFQRPVSSTKLHRISRRGRSGLPTGTSCFSALLGPTSTCLSSSEHWR